MSKDIKTEKNTITPEMREFINSEIEKTLLNSLNVENKDEAAIVLDNLRSSLQSTSAQIRAVATKEIVNLAGEITLKVFTQDIFTNNILSNDGLLAAFNDGFLDFGNTKEYILEPLTGFVDYDKNEFIPKDITSIPVESQVINFYQADGQTLAPNSKKWVKPLTIIERNLVQYFLSGKTFEFINNKLLHMAESLIIGQMHILLEFISTATPKKVIDLDTDTTFTSRPAANAADAWVKVFNIINDMCQASNDYAYSSSSQTPRTADQSNLIIFGNIKVFQYLKNLKAFIFHSNLFQPVQDLAESNFYSVPRKFIIGDEKTIIKTATDYYLDTNTLIILDKNQSFKFIHLLETTASQMFARNLANSTFKHIWFTWGMLNWGKMCKITSTKFLTDESVAG